MTSCLSRPNLDPRTPRARFLTALLTSLAITLSTLPAAFSADPVLQVTQDNGEYTIPLGFLTGENNPIELRGASAEQLIAVPVSPRLKITEAMLDFIYTNSISLIPRSQLAVTLDKRVLAQFPLNANQPDNAARIGLPVDSLFSGYRSLGFRVAQHYTNECEDGGAPELYSQVDTRRSVLRIKATRLAVQPSLARLDEVFDKRLWSNQFSLNILSAEAESNADVLDAASLVTQGAALRLDFLPMRVAYTKAQRADKTQAVLSNSKANLPGLTLPPGDGDVILIGTRNSLSPFVSDTLLQRINGGYIGIYPADSDPTRAVLVISGMNLNQVKEAATVLALRNIALPERNDVSVSELEMPEGFRRTLTTQCDEPGCISFSDLRFKNTTMQGMYPKPVEINFWAFPEMFSPQQRSFNARINYAYGAGFDKKSSLNVMLNDHFIQALHLGNIAGEQIQGAKLSIPIAALQQGRNTLSFKPTVIGQDVGGSCVPIFTDHLFVSILKDSRIELPKMDGFIRLPDLNIFSRAVLPYSQKTDGLGTGLLFLSTDDNTVSAGLTLMGKLAQINESALSGIKTVTDQNTLGNLQDIIAVGAAPNLTAAFKDEVSAFLPKVRWQTTQLGSTLPGLQKGFLDWLKNPTVSVLTLAESHPVSAEVTLSEGLGQSSAAVQFQSNRSKGTVTLFTAADSHLLQVGLDRLVHHTTWAKLEGNGMLWDAAGDGIGHSYPATHYLLGNAPKSAILPLFLGNRQWLAVGIALLAILGLAIVTWLILRRRAVRMNGV